MATEVLAEESEVCKLVDPELGAVVELSSPIASIGSSEAQSALLVVSAEVADVFWKLPTPEPLS